MKIEIIIIEKIIWKKKVCLDDCYLARITSLFLVIKKERIQQRHGSVLKFIDIVFVLKVEEDKISYY